MAESSHRTVHARANGIVKSLAEISKDDIEVVGGKGANLGEMYREGLPVPDAFVVTTDAYGSFLRFNGNQEKIERLLKGIDVDDTRKLESKAALVRKMIESSPVPVAVANEVWESYARLRKGMKGGEITSVAVRSSATTEDLKEASFAGQQSSFLNVRSERELLGAIRKCWASAFTPRAIFYRAKKGYTLSMPQTAVVVQKQIASEKSGVGFCVHPVSGDRGVVVIESSWGQGEEIVSGGVTPDMFVLEKETGRVVESKLADKKRMKIPSLESGGLEEFNVPRAMRRRSSLEDGELKQLWSLSRKLEGHYSYPQDFEWAVEGGKVFLLQTRAVTVLRVSKAQAKGTRKPELRGLSASPGMATGPVRLAMTVGALESVEKGDVLVTRMTTPDFVPAMMKTAAIVTDEGGMTSHAAIVSRELGVPCVVGTGDATRILKDRAIVTVDGSNGLVYAGALPRATAPKEDVREDVSGLKTRTKVYMNLGVPEKISDYANLPFDGIGLMRLEFVIASYIREHPLHMLNTGRGPEFVKSLAEAIATVAKAIAPRPVVVRFSDFKTNEYKELKGGEKYEEAEPNPIIGWRGVSRYISPQYEKAFRMELRAMKMAREDMKLKNVWAMLPFVRTTWEVKKCLNIIEEEGLVRDDTFKLWFMAEVPSTVFLAREFAEFCDGFSIGSNDLTQLILGIDRDSSRLGNLGYFDERNGAVKEAIRMLVEGAHEKGKTVSICGQAPSVYPDFTEFLIGLGIDSISVNPDVVAKTRKLVHDLETKLLPTARATGSLRVGT